MLRSMTTKLLVKESIARPRLLSVIIPLGPNEVVKPDLFADLPFLPAGCEVILVGTSDRNWEHLQEVVNLYPQLSIRIATTEAGRARQLNLGARLASGEWLWFLHADSRIGVAQVVALKHAMTTNPDSLLYFNLSFHAKRTRLMALNIAGVWLRSHILKLPFGDQGLCIKAKTFLGLGEFNENLRQGEDFFFVQSASKSGIKINCTGVNIKTSARKYQQNGWFSTTRNHLLWTICHLLPIIDKIEIFPGRRGS